MGKEKIVLGNKTSIAYDAIRYDANCLVIGFTGGNAVELENFFRAAGQLDLEEIKQLDSSGNVKAVQERFDIFRAINIKVGKTKDDNVVEVVLEQEPLIDMRIRHIEERTGNNEEVLDALLMQSLE